MAVSPGGSGEGGVLLGVVVVLPGDDPVPVGVAVGAGLGVVVEVAVGVGLDAGHAPSTV
jgi:hypothetical protein